MGTPVSGTGQSVAGRTTTGDGLDHAVRVVDVITDSNHVKYEDYHGSLSLNGVFYRKIDSDGSEDQTSELLFAYQGNVNYRQVPLVGEIVAITTGPTVDGGQGISQGAPKHYWTHIIPVWNHPNDNVSSVPSYQDQAYGDQFTETGDINPLQTAPGDVIVEGRYGNSIRFGGTTLLDSEVITEDTNNKAIIQASAGRERGDGDSTTLEDINNDAASIYMVEDHVVPLTQANYKTSGYVDGDQPDEADVYQGSQVIINSGRLFFNAKDESILLSSTETIGLNSPKVAIDGGDYVGLDAAKIYLGVAAQEEEQPVLKGTISTEFLDDFLSQFEQVVKGMATLPPAPPAAVAKLIALGNAIQPVIPVLKNRLPNLHSKKVFTE